MTVYPIRLVSSAWLDSKGEVVKPETIVIAEQSGIREIENSELIHLRDAEYSEVSTCIVCGQHAMVWFDSAEKHAVHPKRCK